MDQQLLEARFLPMPEARIIVDTQICSRWVCPVVPRQTILEHHSVIIDNGRILDLLPRTQADRKYQSSETFDLGEQLLIPGLVNSHGHAAMTLLRGYADDKPLMDWLNNHIWPVEGEFMSREFVSDGTELAIAEMIKSGTTCFSDLYFFPDMVMKTALTNGIRAQICFPVVHFANVWARSEEEHIHKGLQVHDDCRDSELMTSCFGPHSPYAVSDQGLDRIVMLSQELDIPIQMHVHETSDEIAQAMQESGQRPLQRLLNHGLLSPSFQAVHLTKTNDDEIELLASNGVHVLHCPESNLKLASGFCPVGKLISRGVNVALGTDGTASNNDLDMFGEMRTAALLAKALNDDPTLLDAFSVLEMATLHGARALGLEDRIGSIEPGKCADVVAVNMSALETQPVYNPLSQLIYTNMSHHVTNVWVNGSQLLRNREFTQMDPQRIINTTRQWQARIAAR